MTYRGSYVAFRERFLAAQDAEEVSKNTTSGSLRLHSLQQTGFRIDVVGLMEATNSLPSTRTERYMVVATKDDGTLPR